MAIVDCKTCGMCGLKRVGINPVNGEGFESAKVMVVGRDPGDTENNIGRPFVGQSGEFLRTELNYYFSDEDYYITNLVKCHTLNNIGPTKDQMFTCFKHLQKEIDIVLPSVILALGKTVSDFLIANPYSIYYNDISKLQMSEICGRVFEVDFNGLVIDVIPVYHPSPRNFAYYDEIRKVISAVSENYGNKISQNVSELESEETEEIDEEKYGMKRYGGI